MSERLQEEVKEIEKAVRHFSDHVNHCHATMPFIIAMSKEHRTLQQAMTNCMLSWIVYLSSLPDNSFDLRNKAAVEIAKQIVEKVPEIKNRLPFI